MWWDGDMNDETQRTLLSWSLAGGQDRRRRWLFGPRPGEAKPRQMTAAQRRAQRQREQVFRSRRIAEITSEGISQRHDGEGYGIRGFGSFRLSQPERLTWRELGIRRHR
jgi:hypothetical protein